jgi:hypothetical protein
MGVVYKAKQRSMQRVVALKMLSGSSEFDETLIQRFATEARICGALNHPNIVRVFSLAQSDTGEPFLVMEYIEGQTLADVLRDDGSLSPERFRRYFDQVLQALEALHGQGIIHRDIKPANLMVTADDTIKLMDFGIAKDIDPAARLPQAITQTGALIGSPWYMSPEQCRGENLDARSDIYSLGCVMYECATGKPAFVGESALEVMYKHLHDQLSTTNEIEIPHHGELIMKAMQKQPSDRFANAKEMRTALASDALLKQAGANKRSRVTSVMTQPKALATAACGLVALLAGMIAFQVFISKAPESAETMSAAEAHRIYQEASIARDQANATYDMNKRKELRKLAREKFEFVLQHPGLLIPSEERFAELGMLRLSGDTTHIRDDWEQLRKRWPKDTITLFDKNYADYLFDNRKLDEEKQFIDGQFTQDLMAHAGAEPNASLRPAIDGRKAALLLDEGRLDAAGKLLEPLAQYPESFHDELFGRVLAVYMAKLRSTGQGDRAIEATMRCLPAAEKFSTSMSRQTAEAYEQRLWVAINYVSICTDLCDKHKFNEFDSWFAKGVKFCEAIGAHEQLGRLCRAASLRYAATKDFNQAINLAKVSRIHYQKMEPSPARTELIRESAQFEQRWWEDSGKRFR